MYKVLLVLILSFSVFAQKPRNSLINAIIPDQASSILNITDDEFVDAVDGINPESIKVLVWNILKSKKDSFNVDFKQLSADRDIMIVQEYMQDDLTQSNWDVPEYELVIGASFFNIFNYDKMGLTGVATLSRIQSTKQMLFRTADLEPLIRTPKVSLATKYPINHSTQELMVINIHAINFVGFSSFKRQLSVLKDVIASHDGPLIFAGDFNTWNRARTQYLANYAKDLGLEDVAFNSDNLKKFLGKPLDHIFIKGLVIKNKKAYKKIKGSDHKPMMAEFAIKEN